MRIISTISLSILLLISAFTPEKLSNEEEKNDAIHWYTIEEALEAQKESPKKMFVDVYTDWCGWCKVMDNKTFTEASVIEFMNKNFYAVKFDAEQKESLTYKGKNYTYITRGSKGVNELALELLDRQLSYPAFVIIDEDVNKLGMFKGYSQPEAFISKVNSVLTPKGS